VPVKKTEPYLDLTTKDGSTARLKPLEIAGDQLIVEMLDGKITQINFKDLDIASQSLVRRALNL